MRIFKLLCVVALALSMAVPVLAHDEGSQTQSNQNYTLVHEGTVLTVIREDGTPVSGATVQVKTEANDPNSTLGEGKSDDQGGFDYNGYIADGAAILRVSDGSTTIIYNLLTDTHSYDSKSNSGQQQSSSVDLTTVAYAGTGVLCLIGVGTVINVKSRTKKDPELGDFY